MERQKSGSVNTSRKFCQPTSVASVNDRSTDVVLVWPRNTNAYR